MRRFIVRIDNHVFQGAAQLRSVFYFLVLEPTMGRHQKKQFDYAGRINSFVTAETRGDRARRIAHIDQRDSKVVTGEFLVGKLRQGGMGSVVNQRLQRFGRRVGLTRDDNETADDDTRGDANAKDWYVHKIEWRLKIGCCYFV